MRDNRLLRLLTVALLAIWSPGNWWCCCRAQAAEPAPEEAKASTCCTAPESPAPTPLADAASGGGCGDDCCPLIPTEAPSCGCQHGAVDAALPAASTAPVIDDSCGLDLDLLAALPPALGAMTAPERPGLTCRGSPRRAPARSLLSLHCMLTT